MKIEFLFVVCCLEQSRADVLTKVIANLTEQMPTLMDKITVFDNGSTVPGVKEQLVSSFSNVYRSNVNAGYWSAVDWWLTKLEADPPDYTYIIESDMTHYDFDRIWSCANFLDGAPDVGSVRLHVYSVANKHLYNKDVPHQDSKRTLWLSHTNKVTNQPVILKPEKFGIYSANFLTQLPALNRYKTMSEVFKELRTMEKFTEIDFQRLSHDRYPVNAILDGGIFNCNLTHYGAPTVTGSWSSEEELRKTGYKSTRFTSILPADQYKVVRL